MSRRNMRMLDDLCEHLIDRDFAPKTFIDVGVCYGTPELFNTLPDAYQILIEPIPDLEERLKLLTTKFRGEYHMIAVADEAGMMTLNIPEDAIEGATLVPGDGQRQIEVPIDTLDNVLGDREFEKPILLKTDCQGFDLKVIEGAKTRLPDIDVVVMEVNLYHPRGNKEFPDFTQSNVNYPILAE